MSKKYIILIVLVILALIAGISVKSYQNKHLLLLSPKKGDIKEAIYGLGTVASNKIFEVKTGMMASVLKQYVNEGDQVKKGDMLISFDGSASFEAPFAGTITKVQYREGEIALPQIPVMRLEDLNDKYIEVSLEQEAALRVRKGQQAQIIFASLMGEKMQGTVKSIYPKDGDFLTHIIVNNLKENILPGMTADVVIEVGSKKDALLIPIKAITDGQVLRKRAGKRSKVAIEIGHNDGTWAEVTSGDIKLTDQLVVKEK